MRWQWLAGLTLAAVVAGCPRPEPEAPDPAKSDVQVNRTDGVVANGSDAVTVTVTVRDVTGNPVAGVQVTLGASGTGNTLSSPPPTDEGGVTTATLVSTVAGTKTITATLPQGAIAKSPQVVFVAGPVSATASSVTVSGTSFTADGVASAIITVITRDAHNNPVAGRAVLLAATGSRNTLVHPASPTDALGVTQGALSSTMAEAKEISAIVGGVTLVQRPVVQFVPGAAAQLSFFVPPGSTIAGSPISPAVQVVIEDGNANRVTTATHDVTVALASPPAGAVLSGTRTVAAVGGVVVFTDLSVNRAGAGYRLSASAAGLPPTISPAFDVTPGPPSRLVFSIQPPASAVSGASLSPAVQVRLEDAYGNVVSDSTTQVTLVLVAGNGATLSGTSSVSASGGVATFTDLSVDKAGSGYTLVATASGFAGATSTTFGVINGPADRLAFVVHPSDTTAGTTLLPVEVAVQDSAGNVVAGDTRPISLSLGSNPAGGALSGSLTVNAVDGLATFSNLHLDKAGSGYSLLASGTAIASAASASFNVLPGAPSQLAFAVSPPGGTAGVALSPAAQVVVRDALGNTVTSSALSVSVALGGAGGATLAGTTTVSAAAGVATFTDLRVDKVGSYTLVASGTGVSGATSGSFTIAPGAPARLAFTVQPSAVDRDAPITPAVKVAIQDSYGNTVTAASDMVSMALGANPGGNLYGSTSAGAVNGEATFSNLRIDWPGSGYTLVASSGTLTQATSTVFNVLGIPDAGTPDAGTPDAGTSDGGTFDGGAPDGGGPLCLPPGQSCSLSDSCCSGVCRTGTCTSPMFCKEPGAACSSGVECCSDHCTAGGADAGSQCSPLVCRDVGQTCTAESECCTGLCTGTCQPLPGSACRVLGQSCFLSSDCCSTNCQGGMCVRAYSCQAYDDICYQNADCCSGVCSATGGGPGRCIYTTGGNGCTQGGNPCTDGNGCCSRVCLDPGTGATVCSPVGGCQVAGDYCDSDSACCGGAPAGTVLCGASDRRCDIGVACRAPGTICGKPTMQLADGGHDSYRLLDGGLYQINSETNCCDGRKLPGSLEVTCRVDRSGSPRCFGGANFSPDGGPPGTCLDGYVGQPPCCVALGEVCQFRDQCCNGALCVPLPGGGPSRCTLPSCDAVGAPCDGGSGNCCPGTQCLITAELTYACQRSPANPDAGSPACRANGAACTGSSQCCSDICGAGTCLPPAACQPQGSICTVNGDCCTGLSCAVPGGATSGTCEPSLLCPSLGQTCSPSVACCSGLQCVSPAGMACDGTTGCACMRVPQ